MIKLDERFYRPDINAKQTADYKDLSDCETNDYEMGLEWILHKYEKCSERYISAESKLLTIATMPFYKRIFLSKKLALQHLNRVLNEYDF